MLDRTIPPGNIQQTTASGDDTLQGTVTLTSANGAKSLLAYAAGKENNSNHLCSGRIQGIRLR